MRTRTTVLVAGTVERTPTHTTRVLIVAIEEIIEHVEVIEATPARLALRPPARAVVDVLPAIAPSPVPDAEATVAVVVEGVQRYERSLLATIPSPARAERPPQSECPYPPTRTVHDCPCPVCEHDRAAIARVRARLAQEFEASAERRVA